MINEFLEFEHDKYYTNTKVINFKNCIELNNIDISIIPSIRNYFYKNLLNLISFKFIDYKIRLEK